MIVGVRLDVLFSYQGNDMMTSIQIFGEGLGSGDQAVQESGKQGFWSSLAIFGVMAVIHVARVMLDLFMTQRFMLAWRRWLTDRLTGDWLDGRAFYRSRFIDDTIDNPDQRIQADIDIFTAGVGPFPEPSELHELQHAALGCGVVDCLGHLLYRHPVEPVRRSARLRAHRPAVDVLDRPVLRVRRHHHRVLDRQAPHQVDL